MDFIYSWSRFSSSALLVNDIIDIGEIIENDYRRRELLNKLSDEDKKKFLAEHWMPPSDFDWP